MGGSGGGFFSGTAKPEDLARRTREAEARTHDDAFETEVEAVLGSALAEFNDRDTQAAQSVFESVTRDIGTDIEGTVDLLFGGSVSRHTYVDGLSDVDALVLMDRTSLMEKSPAMLQQLLANTLRNRYPRSVVSVGALAVTLEHQGLTFQLLPLTTPAGPRADRALGTTLAYQRALDTRRSVAHVIPVGSVGSGLPPSRAGSSLDDLG